MKKLTSFIIASVVVLMGCSTTKPGVQDKNATTDNASAEVARAEDIPVNEDEKMINDASQGGVEVEVLFKDGEYIVDGSYDVHEGDIHEDVDFMVAVTNGVVTSLDLVGTDTHPDSVYHQDLFMQKATPSIVGADLATLDIDVVAGASETTKGFRKALGDLKEQASS